jgi:vacuolar-type H+-ATPase subunit C/Vma6
MLDTGNRAYVYSKACGIIAKSFVGKRIAALENISSINEFERLIFKELRRDLPARELLNDFEKHIEKRAIRHIISIINSYDKPPSILILMLRGYEYANLKSCIHNIAIGRKNLPELSDIGHFGTIHFESFPDLRVMLENTEFEFILSWSSIASSDVTTIEAELDKHYYRSLIESLKKISEDDKVFIKKILAEEISLMNCNLALRLRTYYRKTTTEISGYLFDIKMDTNKFNRIASQNPGLGKSGSFGEISLNTEAIESLDLPLDMRAPWQGWKWEKFLNPEKQGENWKLEPRYFQNAASRYMYRQAMRYFRRMPLTLNSDFCFIKLKEFEEDLLTSVAEGIGLGMESVDVLKMLEVLGENHYTGESAEETE